MAECPISQEVNRIAENLTALLNHELGKPEIRRGHVIEAVAQTLELVLKQIADDAPQGALEPREATIVRAAMSLFADHLHAEMHEGLGIELREDHDG